MFDWAVIGAGPAGIAAVGRLLDHGVSPNKMAWIDPLFSVGDFGTLWRNVPSNTKVKLFLKFLQASTAFAFENAPKNLALHQIDPEKTCTLNLVADALQWISDHLKKTVTCFVDTAHSLSLTHRSWQIKLTEQTLIAKNVILAIGATPKHLSYPALTVIPLEDAMDPKRIKQHIHKNDLIAVFGASHSAILVLRNLVENCDHQILNFYKHPLRFAVDLEDWILFDDSGLKGTTATWARENIDGQLPKNLTRYYASDENLQQYLPDCNKVVYAVGFEKRTLPTIQGLVHTQYIEECGIIAPGLFGLGIAFPEAKYNPFNLLEYRVGLWKFMDYLHRILPIWLKYST